MSFEPDDEATVLRQLREEIAKIREENFVSTLPTNNIGTSSPVSGRTGVPFPAIGITSIVPEVIFTTKDTGVIDLLNFKSKNPTQDFVIGETVTGDSSGATAEVGDIDTLTDTTGKLTLVPNTITGTFTDNEFLDGSISGNKVARADGTQFTQTGRGHLVAGAGSIIASAENVSTPFEIHFIDNAGNDGQTVYIRAIEGQTIRMRRAVTKDTTTGNLDLDESFDIIENGIVFFQFQVASNVSEFGGWVPQISDVSAGVIGAGGTFQFPILYPKENLGTQNGVINLSLTQQDGHYKQITLDGDASLTFSNLPPAINGFKFYVLTIQDGTGGHVYTDLPNSVLFENVLLGQLQTGANAQTLWQFSTADGGTNWHATVINPQGGGAGDNLGNHEATQDLNMKTFNIFDLDVLRYAKGIEPGADSIIGFNTYGSAVENDTKLKWSIPASTLGNPRFYEWQVDLAPIMALRRDTFGNIGLDMLDAGTIDNTRGISFTHLLGAQSSIIPSGVEMRYDNGFGTGQGGFHGFRVANPTFPQWEVREFVNRSNVDLDMITNDILEIDRARFDSFGGFNSIADKDDRLISGGAEGLVLNVPKISPFAGGVQLYFENFAQTQSDKQYSFEVGQFRMFGNEVSDTLGVFFSNGASFVDLNTHIQFTGGINTNAIDPQTYKISVKDSSFTEIQMVEYTGTEHNTTNAGGVKFFTDVNLQTQDLTNVDRIHFNSNNGIVGGNQVAIAGFGDDMQLNIPSLKEFNWRMNDIGLATLDEFEFHMRSSAFNDKPLITSDGGFRYGASFLPVDNPFIDGDSRLINNAGSQDVVFRSGGQLVNLTTLGSGTSFIGFTADDDLDMGTFNIFNLDVLRFIPDGGVIGFNTYGISADAGDFSMNFSVPQNRDYIFQNNLEAIAVLDETGLQLLANGVFADPVMTAREFTALNHSLGTAGLDDGSFRLVAGDVIFGSGGGLVNLTTLGAGGGDNLGNHITTQNLDMNSVLQNTIINFTSLTSFLGHDWFFTTSGMTWNVDQATDFYRWSFNDIPEMELSVTDLNVGNKQVTNVDDPVNAKDAVNLQTLNAGLAGVSPSQWSTFPALQAVNMANFAFSNFAGWTAGIGQAFSVNPTNFSWSVNGVGDFYEWKIAGVPEMQLSQSDLNVGNKQITNVLDPLNSLDAVNLQTLLAQVGGDASQWSTFPALQQVNMANNAFSNFVGFTGGIGQALTVDSSGMRFDVDGFDQYDFRIGGVQKAVFTTAGHALSGGNLNMSTNKIVNVVDPTNPQDVATRAFVIAQGGADLLNSNNVWFGINAFTGTVHSVTSPFIFIGDQFSDTIDLTGVVSVPNILIADTIDVQNLQLSSDLNMQFFRITNLDPGFLPSDAVTKAQLDAVSGADLLNSNNTWFGNQTYVGADFVVTSGFQVYGDQFSDDVNIIGRLDFPLVPKFTNDIDLGTPFNRWRDLNVEFISVASTGGMNVQGFSSFSAGLLVTGQDLALSSGADLVVTSSGSAIFQGATLPQGLFFHSGSQLGFFGAGLDTRNTVNDVVATGNAFTNTLLLTGALNALMFALEDYGLINVV